jgi:hypothetical protein
MARNRLLDAFKEARSITRQEMPDAESLQKYLDIILPQVRQWSEDLREERFYLGESWYEFRDDDTFHDHVLHFFNDDGEYMRSENGDVSNGSWKLVGASNRMIIDYETTEMYDLVFMNENFLILQKLGDQVRLGKDKYFFMVNEKMFRAFKKKTKRALEWPDAMQLLYRVKYDHSQFYQTLTIMVLVIVIIVLIYSII